jgi:hypothetical protein
MSPFAAIATSPCPEHPSMHDIYNAVAQMLAQGDNNFISPTLAGRDS